MVATAEKNECFRHQGFGDNTISRSSLRQAVGRQRGIFLCLMITWRQQPPATTLLASWRCDVNHRALTCFRASWEETTKRVTTPAAVTKTQSVAMET